jgi:hypothetical protein
VGAPFVGQMTDAAKSRRTVGRTRTLTGLFALTVALLFVGQGLLSAAGSGSFPNPTSAPFAGPPNPNRGATPSSAPNVSAFAYSPDGGLPWLAKTTLPKLWPYLSKVPESAWIADAKWLRGGPAPNPSAFSNVSDPHLRAFLLDTGTALAATRGYMNSLCGQLGTVLTPTVACAFVYSQVGLVGLVYFYFVIFGATALQGTANNWVASMMLIYQSYLAQESANVKNLAQMLNLTLTAMSYETSNAALLQIGNASFNAPLVLDQSTVDTQLATVWTADEYTVSSILTQMSNLFSTTFGAGSQYAGAGVCRQFAVNGGDAHGTAAAVTSGCAGVNAPPNGSILPNTQYQINVNTFSDALLMIHNVPFSLTWVTNVALNWSAKFSPVNGGKPIWYNVTGVGFDAFKSANAATNLTFSGPTGSYNVTVGPIAIGGADTLHIDVFGSFPTSTTATADIPNACETLYYRPNPTSTIASAIQIGCATPGIKTVASGVSGSTIYAQQSGANRNLLATIRTMESVSATIAQSYWAFLRGLGYTSVNQIPANCIIPKPNVALPPNIPPSALVTSNASALLSYYYNWLAQLAQTYNSSVNLTALTFCGKHPSLIPNYALTFGVYGIGYVFYPTGKNESGASNQLFAGVNGNTNRTTWNATGLVYISPAFRAMNITINTTWEFPSKEPSFIAVTEEDTNDPQVPYVKLYDNAFGNSTAPNGSAYPATHNNSLGTGFAVYLTQCWLLTNPSQYVVGKPPTWAHPNVCPFNVSTINAQSGALPCGVTLGSPCPVFANGTGGGSSFGGCVGDNLWLIGPAVDAVAAVLGGNALSCLVAWFVVIVVVAALVISTIGGIVYVARRD